MHKIQVWFSIALIGLLAACSTPESVSSRVVAVAANDPSTQAAEIPVENQKPEMVQSDVMQSPEEDRSSSPESTATVVPDELVPQAESAEPEQPVQVQLGPDEFPQGVNPLTGQPCANPELLKLPPALISVSNFPVTSRPQAGLSYSPYVFELYIGEGMTRFLAMFYCDFPQEQLSGDNTNTIGPVRSGRLPYEGLRKLYNGFLIMASASSEVGMQLGNSTNVFSSDSDDINSALIDVSKLQSIAQQRAGTLAPNLTGNLFSQAPSSRQGDVANQVWVFYNFLNQVMWTYDPAMGAYLRAQDNADGSGEFTDSTDRLTGEPLAFENVIVLFAEHEVLNSEGTLIDVNLLYTGNKALLFRDGQMFPIRWTTIGGEYEKTTGKLRPMRFVDSEGNPVALKPGKVWVEMVHLTTTLQEVDPGMWKVRFYAP